MGRKLLAVGRRAPDFALPRGGDQPVRFYGVAGGRPVLLLFSGTAGAAAVEQARSLVDADTFVEVVVVHREPAGADGDFLDADGHVHRGYGVLGEAPGAVLLDENLRVRATAWLGDPAGVVAGLVALLPPAPDGVGPLAAERAPVLFVPRALAPDLREELMQRWATEGNVATGVETVVDGARAEATDVRRKRRRDHVVTDTALQRRLTQHIGARVLPELQQAFAFAGGGFEGFKVGCYESEDAGHFEAHRDNLSTATQHRRFGLTLNLNDDYEGGELCFPEYGTTRYLPAPGEALLFSGSLLHEVRPVTRGRRFVLVSFVLSSTGHDHA